MAKCPCGERNSPDPSCDICDDWTHDPDTGWGGFTDGYAGRHFDSFEKQSEYYSNHDFDDDEHSW